MLTYISTNNLARYDGKIQEYAEGLCAPHGDACWRITEKAQSVSFWPVGSSPLGGTVEFSFTETPPESGTKGPDNPSTITGVDSIFLAIYGEDGVNEAEYSIDLGGVYYGGSIDLATGLMTVTQFFYSFTGEEFLGSSDKGDGWTLFSYRPSEVLPLAPADNSDKSCSHFDFLYSNTSQSFHWYVQSGGLICMFSNQFTDDTAIKTWLAAQALAGTPVQVTYRMRTPYTVQLTPTQILSLTQPDKYVPRPNTVYTDADAVQIVYQKSPIRDEFEKVQAIIAQGGNV